MPSAGDTVIRTAIIAAVLSLTAPMLHPASAQSSATTPAAPSQAEVAGALARVKADPNLATQQTIKMLRWKDSGTKREQTPSSFAWIAGLFRWLDQSARVLMWCVVAVLLAGLVYFLAQVIRHRRHATGHDDATDIPTHVGDLDIRPEALPADIGGAAREMWDRGEHRPALALLYRGLLSRLAHVHKVPIRDGSTEGDCLALAGSHVQRRPYDYAAHLVRTWQRFGYGSLEVQTDAVYRLCEEFAPALDPVADIGAPDARGTR